MRKALALILGITIIFINVPSISAFADSDPGFSNLVMNHSFSWYTDFPYVDTNGWIYNSYLQSATLVSNGVTSHPDPITIATLYQPGDYFEVSFDSDLLSSYQTPLWNVLIAYDSSTSSTHIEIPNDSINCYLNDELAFYEFQTYLAVDNRRWRCVSFICQSSYLQETTIRFEYEGDGSPVRIPVTMIMFRGYRFTPSGSLTVQEMVELQSNIINALNTARLADIIGNLDTSDVDLTTLENTTASILQKLANVPDIIQYIDGIETQNSQILSAINTFYSFYYDQFNYFTVSNYSISVLDKNGNTMSSSFTTDEFYFVCPLYSADLHRLKNYTIYFNSQDNLLSNFDISYIEYSYGTSFENSFYHYSYHLVDRYYISQFVYASYNYPRINIIIDTFDINTLDIQSYIYIHVKLNSNQRVSVSGQYSYIEYNKSWYLNILLYLKQILGNQNSDITQSVDSVTDTVSDQIDDITQFEDTYNQSLDTSASQIDVSSYQITQTSGMSWMRTYTEYNFDQMQNFRILFLTPLVLALAAFFLRRKQ